MFSVCFAFVLISRSPSGGAVPARGDLAWSAPRRVTPIPHRGRPDRARGVAGPGAPLGSVPGQPGEGRGPPGRHDDAEVAAEGMGSVDTGGRLGQDAGDQVARRAQGQTPGDDHREAGGREACVLAIASIAAMSSGSPNESARARPAGSFEVDDQDGRLVGPLVAGVGKARL